MQSSQGAIGTEGNGGGWNAQEQKEQID